MTAIAEQADKIAAFILREDTSLDSAWLRWIFKRPGARKGDLKLIKDEFLNFIHDSHADEFSDALASCKTTNGFSIDTLVRLMTPDKCQAVVKKLGLNYDPRFVSAQQILNEGLGKKLIDHVKNYYGFDQFGDNAVDAADLLHAASFQNLAEAAHSHHLLRPLADYLSSTSQKLGAVFDPGLPPLDAILAFFNAYDDKAVIENIIFDIERRAIFKRISTETTRHSNDPKKYSETLNRTLDEILDGLRQREQSSQLAGSKRISQRLIARYSALRHFSLPGIRTELDGCVFPRFYQAQAILDIYRNKRFLIADEMGTGKTAIAVLASEYIAQQKGRQDFRTLIVTTNTNKRSLAEKIQAYLSLSYEEADNVVGIISSGDRRSQYQDLQEHRYIIINYELLRAKDWRLEDYKEWEVEEEEYEQVKAKLTKNYGALSESKKRKTSELEFILSKIPLRFRDGIVALDDAYDAFIKINDLNSAKTVAQSLEDSFTFDHVVVDEIQNGKNSATLNSKAILRVTKNAEYVTCLSGTPFVNGLSDLGIIFEILGVYDEMIRVTEKKLRRLEQSLDVDENDKSLDGISAENKKRVLQHRKNLENLKNAVDRGDIQRILLDNPRMIRDYLRPKMLRRRSKEVLMIPDVNFRPQLTRTGESLDDLLVLPMYQRMAYQILQSHDFKNSSDQLRALQMLLLSGGLYVERFKSATGKNSGVPPRLPDFLLRHLTDEHAVKYAALERLIESITSSTGLKKRNVVVFSSLYKRNVTAYLQKRLQERFADISVLRIDGDVVDSDNNPERTNTIKRFNESEKPSVLLATLPTMKEAIELHHNCSSVVFLDLPFTWAEYSQGIARVWRADQDEVVNVYDLIVSDSLDIGKLELILDKKRLGELLLQGMPINEAELKVLSLTETSPEARGFIERYVYRSIDSSMKIMRDLYAAGADKVKSIIGERNARSEVYANAYILNLMSVACLREIAQDMIGQGILDTNTPKKLDGRVLDLASGYGTFAHVTGIQTENLEINPFMIERAKEYAPAARYTQGVMQDVHRVYGDSRFEAVIFSLSFHYASDEERGRLLYDIHRTLQPNGCLFLTESAASIDERGRETLVDVLQQTGYQIVKSEEVKVADKNFYKVVARKTGDGQLYDKPFKLREFVDEKSDLESLVDLKDMYSPAEGATAPSGFGEEFGPGFNEMVGK